MDGRRDLSKRAKSTQPNPSPSSSTQQSVKNASRTRRLTGRSPSGKMARLPCKDYLKGTCNTPFYQKCISQSACSFSQKVDADLVKSALMHTARLKNSLAKRSQKNGDKSAVAMLKITRQLGCVFQEMEPPKSTTILRKSSNILKPIRCVRFTKAMLRHANIRDQNPSLGLICPGDPKQRKPQCPKQSGKKRRKGKSDIPVKPRGIWQDVS